MPRIGSKQALSSVFAVFFAVFPAPLNAQTTQTIAIHLDPDATTIHWTLNSIVHRVHGTFKLKGGDVVVDPKTGLAQGEILIDATSGSSGDASRDAKWQKEVLDSATFPAIIFHPTKIEGIKPGDGTQNVKAIGTMTLHGQDHPVEIMCGLTIKGTDVNMTAHYVIPYVQWGLKDASAGIVRYDKQVTVDMDGKGKLKKELASAASAPAPDSQ